MSFASLLPHDFLGVINVTFFRKIGVYIFLLNPDHFQEIALILFLY